MSTPERRKPFPFDSFEPKWQQVWLERQTFHVPNPGEPGFDPGRPKYYVLDMFPYPSGQGLHVGHPEGYTATDILGRTKRRQGFNVLHPMGWDAFGLPAEQYAIKTGQHPRVTTAQNVAHFRGQLQRIGFGYDWHREVNTTDPGYFRWTQWIFLQLYNSYYDPELKKAQPIALLDDALSASPRRRFQWEQNAYLIGTHEAFVKMTGEERARTRESLLERSRLAYVSEAPVNWCPALGTVLANEEVIDGKSEVGGHPVERRPMRQWMLRITAYAQRLIDELEELDWPDSIKALQRNWIGRSEGAEVTFQVDGQELRVFTTRPDTLYGATYMVLAPEHPMVDQIVTEDQWPEVRDYREKTARKSDLERTELTKDKTGVWTGAYATNPVNGERIPIWVADYVLLGYGTGAIMAVPAHDDRDWDFARKYALPIREVVSPTPTLGLGGGSSPCSMEPLECFVGEGYAIHSGPLDGLPTAEAKKEITRILEERGLGRRTINYKLRDWLFSRQRYWGEPFPIVWEGGRHRALDESELPVTPPEMDDFKPTGTPEAPLSKAKDWLRYHPTHHERGESSGLSFPLPSLSIIEGAGPGGPEVLRETNTMPQWAGSCWYYLRYCDAQNAERFVGEEAERYWMGGGKSGGVDLYVGGTEHAVLHLLYARFWHKVLFDLGYVSTPEPFQRLVNQGLILGEDGQKMSKSRGNVVNPDIVITSYGADSLRCYEMFMGPLEQSKPWSMAGVEGIFRFLARIWRLVMEENQAGEWVVSAAVQEIPMEKTIAKVVHATIRKVTEDVEALAFNTAISQMMVCCNALTQANPRSLEGVRLLLSVLNPFAPHLTEELWDRLATAFPASTTQPGTLLADATWPTYDPAFLVEDEIELPVQVNGKVRTRLVVSKDATPQQVEAAALAAPAVIAHLERKTVRKVVVVPGRMVNIVIG